LYYTSSGIITPVGGRPVHRTATYRCDEMLYNYDILMMST